MVDGDPVVLPTIHARIGENLYVHASTGASLIRMARVGGLAVCLTVTLLDGIVLARSQFHHSMNYRSVVVRGTADVVNDTAEKARALTAIVEHISSGRSLNSRPGDAKELAATAVLRLPLRDVSLKRRTGPPTDDDADLRGPYWAGVIPVALHFGHPQPAPDLRADVVGAGIEGHRIASRSGPRG